MSTSYINHLASSTDLQSLMAEQMSNKNSSTSNANNGQTSAFAQMLGAASGDLNSSAASTAAGSSSNPAALLNQLVASYQTTSVQSQSSSLDPMSMAS